MGMGDLPGARQLFRETIEQFPHSEEAFKARYKLAVIELLEGDEAAAQRRFQAIIDRSHNILIGEAAAMSDMLRRRAQDE
jgi:TolA-binding protein